MIRLSVRAPAEAAEAVLADLLELSPAGVEEVHGDGWVEYALYGAPAELPALPEGEARLAGAVVLVRREAGVGDWAERWKRFHRPVLVGGRMYVRPPWDEPAVGAGIEDVVIDPGRAFGTGAHSTTEGCLELLLELAGGPDSPPIVAGARSLADLGCGSGVVAIAAAKLGFAPVTAADCDPAALEATARNARTNAVELDRIERADLRRSPAPTADVVVANLTRPLLLRVAELMGRRPQALVASGLLDEETDEVVAAFASLLERRRVCIGGWTSVLLGRP